MNNTALAHKEPPMMHLKIGVATYLIPSVHYGHVTIRFEAGRATLAEIHEHLKLTGGERRSE